MRLTAVPIVLVAAALAGCGDRRSTEAGQGNAAAEVAAASPDEAPAAAAAPAAGTIDRSHRGEATPTLGFTDPAGKSVTLAAYRGKPVLLNLWATWCGPCVKELPTLDALATREAGRLTVVTLSQDLDPAKATAFFAARGFRTLKASTDAKMAWVPSVAATLPTSILIDAAGKEVWRVTGDLDWTGAAATRALAENGKL